jgi:hypothetical protein
MPGYKQPMKSKMKTIKLVTLGALFAAVAVASFRVCKAGQAAATPSPMPEVEEEKKSRISGEVGVSLTNAYIFNGLIQDKDTFIAQPYLTLNFMLYEGEGFLYDASFTLPLWASIHDINIPRAQNGKSSLKDWYEFDISPGFSFTFAKREAVVLIEDGEGQHHSRGGERLDAVDFRPSHDGITARLSGCCNDSYRQAPDGGPGDKR